MRYYTSTSLIKVSNMIAVNLSSESCCVHMGLFFSKWHDQAGRRTGYHCKSQPASRAIGWHLQGNTDDVTLHFKVAHPVGGIPPWGRFEPALRGNVKLSIHCPVITVVALHVLVGSLCASSSAHASVDTEAFALAKVISLKHQRCWGTVSGVCKLVHVAVPTCRD